MADLRKLDLNLLVVFDAVYTAGNVSRAAKTLNVSQPTISNALTRLRDSLDDPLFVREGRGVSPTSKAKRMIGPVRAALQTLQAGIADEEVFDPKTSQRNFRIVVLDLLEPVLLPPVVREIQSYRSVTLEMLPVINFPIAEGLSDGSLDLALSVFDPQLEDIECQQVGVANVIVAARKGHPQVNGEMTKELLESIGHIALTAKLRAMSRIDEALRYAQIDRHIVYTTTKFWSFPQIIATTDLIALLPGSFAAQAAKNYPLDLFPLPFEFPDQQIYMIWKKSKNNDPGHSWLRQSINRAYQNSLLEGDIFDRSNA